MLDVAEELKEVILNVPDVAEVNISGGAEREVMVAVDRNRLESFGLSLNDVVQAIRSSHNDTPIGDFEIDGLEYSLRFAGKHQTAEDVADVVIRNVAEDGAPSLITVSDVATVTEQAEDNDSIYRFVDTGAELSYAESLGEKWSAFLASIGKSFREFNIVGMLPVILFAFLIYTVIRPPRFNGSHFPRSISILLSIVFFLMWFFLFTPPPQLDRSVGEFTNAVELSVSRKSQSDILRVDRLTSEAAQNHLEQNYAGEIDATFILNAAEIMREDYKVVLISALESFLIVMAFIFFFVGIKEGLVASIVIPITFLVTIGILNLLGKTLNFMTNFSMILALGILVDTAIVIVEGVHRFIKLGYSPRQAAILSLHEYRGPLIAGTLTTLAVFIPLLTLSGILGQFLSFIPQTVIIVLSVSLVVSLFLLPAYAALLVKPEADKKPPKRLKKIRNFASDFRVAADGFIEGMRRKYGIWLKNLIATRFRRLAAFGLVFLVFFLSFLIPIKFELFPSGDSTFLTTNIELPEGTVAETTSIAAAAVEEVLLDIPEVLYVRTGVNGKSASIVSELLSSDEREDLNMRTSLEVENALSEKFDAIARRLGASLRVQRQQGGPPSEFPVGFRVIVRDRNKIVEAQELTQRLTDALREIENSSGVKNDIERIPGEFRFEVDRDRAVSLGIDPSQVPSLVRIALQGSTAATITRAGRDIDIVVQIEDLDIPTIDDLNSLRLFTAQGSPVLLEQLITVTREDALAAVRRSDGDIAFTVSSLLGPGGNAQEITTELQEKIDAGVFSIPEGIEVVSAGENEENADLISDLMRGLGIAVLLIFLILVVMLNAFFQPILILLTILFAQIGVSFGLWLTDTPRSLAYILGIIALAGIVVNDAIIMIDQMNKNREHRRTSGDPNALAAIVEAGKSRFIPVILTTLTSSAGIIPLIFQDEFWAGLSYTVIFGLMVASTMTLFITPAVYFQIEKEPGVTSAFMMFAIIGSVGVFMLVGGSLVPGGIALLVAGAFYLLTRFLIRRKDRKTSRMTEHMAEAPHVS